MNNKSAAPKSTKGRIIAFVVASSIYWLALVISIAESIKCNRYSCGLEQIGNLVIFLPAAIVFVLFIMVFAIKYLKSFSQKGRIIVITFTVLSLGAGLFQYQIAEVLTKPIESLTYQAPEDRLKKDDRYSEVNSELTRIASFLNKKLEDLGIVLDTKNPIYKCEMNPNYNGWTVGSYSDRCTLTYKGQRSMNGIDCDTLNKISDVIKEAGFEDKPLCSWMFAEGGDFVSGFYNLQDASSEYRLDVNNDDGILLFKLYYLFNMS